MSTFAQRLACDRNDRHCARVPSPPARADSSRSLARPGKDGDRVPTRNDPVDRPPASPVSRPEVPTGLRFHQPVTRLRPVYASWRHSQGRCRRGPTAGTVSRPCLRFRSRRHPAHRQRSNRRATVSQAQSASSVPHGLNDRFRHAPVAGRRFCFGDKALTILGSALAHCSPRYADIRPVENVRQIRGDADVFKTAMLALFRRATDDQINRAIGELERLATERGGDTGDSTYAQAALQLTIGLDARRHGRAPGSLPLRA
jgi:hypothetical protein